MKMLTNPFESQVPKSASWLVGFKPCLVPWPIGENGGLLNVVLFIPFFVTLCNTSSYQLIASQSAKRPMHQFCHSDRQTDS